MKILQKIIAILAFLIGGPVAFGQIPSGRINDISIANYSGSLHSVAGATITVCTSGGSGLPCTPLATIYTDGTGTVIAPNPFTADANGNYGFWAPPGNYFVSLTGTVPTWQSITYTIPPLLNGNNAWSGNETHSGTETFGAAVVQNLNNTFFADQFSGADPCAKIVAAKTALLAAYPGGGIVDATNFLGANTCASTLNLDGSGAPILFKVSPGESFAISANPAVCYGNSISLVGSFTNSVSPYNPAFTTSVAGDTVLKSCDYSTQTTNYFHAEGVNFVNTNSSTTAAVVDLTDTSNTEFKNVNIEHAGGTGDLVYCYSNVASGYVAFYNVMNNVEINGTTSAGIGYHLADECNDFKVIGGKVDQTSTPISANGSSLTYSVNGVDFIDVSFEQWANAWLTAGPYAYNIGTIGGRIESTEGGSTLFAITNTGSHVRGIVLYNPDIQGSTTQGTDAGVVTVLGYAQGGQLFGLIGNLVPNGSSYCWSNSADNGLDCLGVATDSLTYNSNPLVSSGTITLSGGAGSHSFANTYSGAPVCTANDVTTAANAVTISSNTTTISVTGTGTDHVNWICVPAGQN